EGEGEGGGGEREGAGHGKGLARGKGAGQTEGLPGVTPAYTIEARTQAPFSGPNRRGGCRPEGVHGGLSRPGSPGRRLRETAVAARVPPHPSREHGEPAPLPRPPGRGPPGGRASPGRPALPPERADRQP